MQKIIFSFIAFTLLVITGCKKKEVISDFKSLDTGSYLTLVRNVATTFNFNNIASSSVGIVVAPKGSDIERIKVFVSPGNKSVDKSTWKAVKEIPFSGEEVTITVSSQELATALGVQVMNLTPGNTYTFYNQVITKDGRTFDIANTPQHGISNYNMALNWSAAVICPFTGNAAGQYRVVQDAWQDWSAGDIVEVTDGPGANQINLSKVWPNPAYGSSVQPFVVSVTPATGAATVASGVTIGDYPAFGFTMVTGAGSTGFVFSCTGRIQLSVRISDPPFGDQGFQALVLQKL